MRIDFYGAGGLSRISGALSRSISAENPTGEPGMGARAPADPRGHARELGTGNKCRPCIQIPPGETALLADITGPGAIQSIWMTGTVTRDMILRIYWEDSSFPSVEAPMADFFAAPFANLRYPDNGPACLLRSIPVCVNPNRALSCFWEMPFRRRCRVTMTNLHPLQEGTVFYQISYTLAEVPKDSGYFHTFFRLETPVPRGNDYLILPRIQGKGHYVGTAMGFGIHNNGWWGEGEIKFFMDGDDHYPTICGTGTEDYFLGAYNWDIQGNYTPYCSPYAGMYQVLRPDGCYQAVHRQAAYRWHIPDPIRFARDLRVSMQLLGWRSEGRFYPQSMDVSSTAYWYQETPAQLPAQLPTRDALEII